MKEKQQWEYLTARYYFFSTQCTVLSVASSDCQQLYYMVDYTYGGLSPLYMGSRVVMTPLGLMAHLVTE